MKKEKTMVDQVLETIEKQNKETSMRMFDESTVTTSGVSFPPTQLFKKKKGERKNDRGFG